jgi:2-dehydro-3-deoxyphosphogluconate aldolase/(4S)-4-hydroxy-2-oxoglutarate aldolase
MPTGGVSATRESLESWFKAGVSCVGIGSNLITKEIIKSQNWSLLSENIKNTLALIKEIRK